MNFLTNLKIRTKLFILIIFTSLLMIAIGATGLLGIHSSTNALSSVYNDHLLSINQLNEIRNNQMQMLIELSSARQEKDAFEILGHIDKVRSNMFQIENILTSYGSKKLSAEEKILWDAFVTARTSYGMSGVIPTIDLLQGEKFDEADKLRKETLDPAYAKASHGIDSLIGFQVDKAKDEYEKITKLSKITRIGSIASIIIGLSLSILIGYVITRSVSCGVRELAFAATKLANGDLTTRASWDSKDELGDVARVFNKMAENFAALIHQVRDSTDRITEATKTQSSTAEKVLSLSNSQTAQAASAAQSIEGLNMAVKDIAQRAESVVLASNEASDMSSQGQKVVNNAVQGIQQISQTVSESANLIAALGQRSDQIGQIVKVIKDIADQTNLLALNAAIEAARAGEQGRGFAVVADEVRKLAERTTSATAEISGMITAIQSETSHAVVTMEKGSTQVSDGVALANQAGESLLEINSSVKRVVEMIQQIAASTRSQSEATNEITASVEHIADMARENADSVAMTTDASHDLEQLSGSLQQLISQFKL